MPSRRENPMKNRRTIRYPGIDHVLLLGGGALLVCAIDELRRQGFAFVVVSCRRQLDEIVASGGKNLRTCLRERGIPVRLSEDVAADRRMKPLINGRTLGLSLSAPWIFSKGFIDRFGGRLLNLHGARLPLKRGGGGVSWQMLGHDVRGGVTLHRVEPGIDTGDVLLQRKFTFPAGLATPAQRFDLLLRQGRMLLKEMFLKLRKGESFRRTPQDDRIGSYWPRLSTELQGYVDWRWTAGEIVSFTRAFAAPYPGASTFLDGRRVYIRRAAFRPERGTVFHPFQAGLIFRISGGRLSVAGRGGAVEIASLTDASGRPVLAVARVGDRFHTPARVLDQAMSLRVRYSPAGLES